MHSVYQHVKYDGTLIQHFNSAGLLLKSHPTDIFKNIHHRMNKMGEGGSEPQSPQQGGLIKKLYVTITIIGPFEVKAIWETGGLTSCSV